jgi:hypothetical protein
MLLIDNNLLLSGAKLHILINIEVLRVKSHAEVANILLDYC